jgi:renalase
MTSLSASIFTSTDSEAELRSRPIDFVVIGAGLAGLTAAQELQQQGLSVVVLEKSRGVGGRMATRRLPPHANPTTTIADHGTCYLSPQSADFQAWLEDLEAQGVMKVWINCLDSFNTTTGQWIPDPALKPCYIGPTGINALPKILATGLEIRFNHRVVSLHLDRLSNHWHLQIEPTAQDPLPATIITKSLILTAPAPQTLELLQPLAGTVFSKDSLEPIAQATFAPCISVMAGYGPEKAEAWQRQFPNKKALTIRNHGALGYLGWESSKRPQAGQPTVFVAQSTAAFAQQSFRDYPAPPIPKVDFTATGQELLQAASELLVVPWLAKPDWISVQRWKYALPLLHLAQDCWVWESPLLICGGDWCGGDRVEAAWRSGLAIARQILAKQDTVLK